MRFKHHGLTHAVGTDLTVSGFFSYPGNANRFAFQQGGYWGTEDDSSAILRVTVGDQFRVTKAQLGEFIEAELIHSAGTVTTPLTPTITKEPGMQGAVYEGVVVKTSNVVAAEGASAVVQKSEILYVSKPFIAGNVDAAKSRVAVEASDEVDNLDFSDPLVTIEVKLRTFA